VHALDVLQEMRIRYLALILASASIALVAYAFFGRIEQQRKPDPMGKYFAVWSHQPFQYLPFVGLGTDSDSPCFVKIIDTGGKSFGEIPVVSKQVSDVEWTHSGAEIKLVGEWDLVAGTCFYWSEDQERKIYVR
jgi:hypothetical protein